MAKPLAVLIVEDSESDAQLVVRLLHKAGFKVDYEVVDTVKGMRAALKKQAWDIVISDYSLPQFNGSAALTLLKETGGDIPFIVVSGTMGEETAVAMMKAGAQDYLVKGNLARLVPAIERELEQAVVRRERRQAQEEMQASEKRFRALIENSSDAITLLDVKGKVLYDSPSAPGMLGYGPKDWIGTNAFKLMHPDDLQKNQDIFQDLQKTPGKSARTIFRLKQKSGDWLWIEATATNLLEEPTVNAIVLNYRDITGRKQAEEALRENESILRSFLEQSEDAIMLTDEQGAVIQWSKGAERLTGYSRDESQGQHLWDVQFRSAPDEIKSPENYERLKAVLQEALRTGRGTFLNHLVEAEIHRPNGTRAATQTMAFSIQTHKGFMLGSILRDISGRKRREEQLVESESRYKGLFEDSPISLWEEDFSVVKKRLDALRADGITDFQEYFTSHPEVVTECAVLVKVVDVNKAAIKLLGANEKGDLFKGLADILKNERDQGFQKELINITEGKTNFGWEGTNRTLDGRLINIQLNWSAVPGHENTLSRVLVSMMDITERKQAEEALKEIERVKSELLEKLNEAQHLAMVGSWDWDLQTNQVWWSDETYRIFGVAPQEFVPSFEANSKFIHPDDLAIYNKSFEHSFQTGEPLDVDLRLVANDGLLKHCHANGKLIFDHSGRPINFIGTIMDITERKQAEESIRLSEERFRTLYENTTLGLYRTTPDGRILLANPALVRMLGFRSFDELKTKNLNQDWYQSSKPRSQFIEMMDRQGQMQGLETTWKHQDGSLIFIRESARAIRDHEGNTLYYDGTVEDITERKQAEEALRESEVRYKSLFEDSPISLWEEDFSLVKGRLDALRADGVTNFQEYFITHPEAVAELIGLIKVVDINKATMNIFGANQKADMLKNMVDLFNVEKIQEYQSELISIAEGNTSFEWDGRNRTLDGRLINIQLNWSAVPGFENSLSKVIISMIDNTKRKQAEEALARSEREYRTLFENMPIGLYRTSADGRILDANQAMVKMFGYPDREALLAENVVELYFDPASDLKFKSEIEKTGVVSNFEAEFKRPDGTVFWTEDHNHIIRNEDGTPLFYEGSLIDITERKRVKEELLAERDLLTTLINTLPDNIFIKDVTGRIVMNNTTHRRMLGANTLEQAVGKTDFDFFPRELASQYDADERQVIQSGQPLIDREEPAIDKNGNQRWLRTSKVPLRDRQGNITGIVGFNHDITERKQAEEMLLAERDLLTTLINTLPDSIFIKDVMGRILMDNYAHQHTLGANTLEQVVGKTDFDFHPREQAAEYDADEKQIVRSGEPLIDKVEPLFDKNHNRRWLLTTKVPLRDRQGNITGIVGFNHDITERKQAEEKLSEERNLLRTLVDNLPDRITVKDIHGRKSLSNLADWRASGGKKMEDVIGLTDFDTYPPELAEGYWAVDKAVLDTGMPSINHEERGLDADGNPVWVLSTKVPLRDGQGNVAGLVGIGRDITERKQADERIQHQIDHLAALRAIDQMIISSFDLRNSLTEILKHVTKELGVDAADVLTLGSGYQSLEFSAGIGFRTRAAEKASLRLGHSHAGRVALERQLIQIPNLRDQPDEGVLKTVLAGEDFVCYFGVPLIAKGSVKGVLEVYHRSPLEPDGEWLEFLNTLADQAALAIDNSHLFENLQRSNIDLTLAYDATIEGWSRAMDLRDKETEGHTLRVTEITMELAALFGIKDEDLVGARRGALLHDIGKMGVPDGILLKPEKLTEEEWLIMKKHPSFAFDMLSPIHYLQSAMDIPYCHHEKWDGTGYPRGLKGEQIPLIARIFSLADVWDALTSDRPYRKAWSNEKALEYLKSESGKHFDPAVVRICLGSGVFDRKKQN